MSFLKPERPKPIPIAREPVIMPVSTEPDPAAASYASLISTGTQGLKRKAGTSKSSLIGGG